MSSNDKLDATFGRGFYNLVYVFDNGERISLRNIKNLADALTEFSGAIENSTDGEGKFINLHEPFQYERISIIHAETGKEVASFVGL